MWPPKFSDAIEALNVARRRCEHLVTAGLAQPDVNTVASVIVVARDCARIATLTTQLLERGSKNLQWPATSIRKLRRFPVVRKAAASVRRNARSWRTRRSPRADRRVRAGNPKSQAPSSKEIPSSKSPAAREAPNPKFQIPRKSQTSNSKEERRAELPFDHWALRPVWDLGFGIWDFRLS
jgi:hypothetical protein